MSEEFKTLSQELQLNGKPLISERNINKIKEFIRLLKEWLGDETEPIDTDEVKAFIDKIAGSDLIEEKKE